MRSVLAVRILCHLAAHRRRHQGHDLGRLLQSVRGARPRVRKVDRPQARHHARALARRFTGGDPDAPGARRAGGRPDHGRARRRYPGDARHDSAPAAGCALAESFIGMVVRAGQPKPDISTVEAPAQDAARREIHRLFGQFERHVSVDRRIQEARRRGRDRRQDAQGARSAVGRAGGGGRRARRGGDRLPAGRRTDPCAGRRFRRHGAGRDSAADLFRRRTAEGFATARCRSRAAAFPVVRGGRGRHHEGRIEAAGGR